MKARRLIDYIFITLKGMAMGAADVVPGVSGGTVAFAVAALIVAAQASGHPAPHSRETF